MISLRDICDFLEDNNTKYKLKGDINQSFTSFCPLNNLKESSITWVRNVNTLSVDELNKKKGIVLVASFNSYIEDALFPIFYVEDPHKTYFQIIERFFKNENPDCIMAKIERTAVVLTKNIGKDIYVGYNSVIGPDVEIGNHVRIHHNVTIQGKVKIGDNTVIESGTSIGVCGYGPYWDENGDPVLVPHVGDVIIGSFVHLGANNCISRGCLGSTVIEDYVKTDNLVHIAHNDIIKRGAMLTANVVLSGSVTIEENAWLAPSSVVNEALTIGRDSILGVGTVVISNVPKHKVVVGNPSKILREKIDGEL